MRKDAVAATASVRRRHVWKPFSVRIEEVQINATRTFDRHAKNESEVESYFKSGLQKWCELDLSIPFTTFVKDVADQAKSLAQVIHHKNHILRSLLARLTPENEISLVALLDMLVCLARDIREDIVRDMETILRKLIILTHSKNVETVEHTFRTLAHLYKELSAFLCLQVITIFDITKPLFLSSSVSSKRNHVLRFASESLCFLLRRATTPRQKLFLEHIVETLRASHDETLVDGLAYLFLEVVQGVKHTIHGRGVRFLSEFLDHVLVADRQDAKVMLVLERLTIGLVHHCTSETIAPIWDLYTQLLRLQTSTAIQLGWRLCFLLCAVRKGTRVKSWKLLCELLKTSMLEVDHSSIWLATRLCSVVFTYADHEILASHSHSLLPIIAQYPLDMLAFAVIMAVQHPGNFEAFVWKGYIMFLEQSWSISLQTAILRGLHEIVIQESYNIELNGGSAAFLQAKLEVLLSQNSGLTETERLFCITVYQRFDFVNDEFAKGIIASYSDRIEREELDCRLTASIIGQCLSGLKHDRSLPGPVSAKLQQQCLWEQADFLCGVVSFMRENSIDLVNDHVADYLARNLLSGSHKTRQYSLQLLQSSKCGFTDIELEALAVCDIIEATELTLDASRPLAIQFRKLNGLIPSIRSALLAQCLINLNMAFLLINYTPLWAYGSECLGVLAKTWPALLWDSSSPWLFQAIDISTVLQKVSSDFECPPREDEPGLEALRCFNEHDLRDRAARAVALLHAKAPPFIFVNSVDGPRKISLRSQATRIYTQAISLLEEHSGDFLELFVRVFPEYSSHDDDDVEEDPAPHGNDREFDVDLSLAAKEKTLPSEFSSKGTQWSRVEQKDLLSLATKLRNSTFLKSSEAFHNSILHLLASRDNRTQSAAFEIIMKFGDPNLAPYKDHFLNLLSETRFRDELTTFLQSSDNESVIEDAHRESVLRLVSRILYGRMVSRRHAESQKKGLASNRNIVLSVIATLPVHDIRHFISLFVEPFKSGHGIDKSCLPYVLDRSGISRISLRKQLGYCTLLVDALHQLGSKAESYLDTLLEPLIFCRQAAMRILKQNEMDVASDLSEIDSKVAKNILTTSLAALNDMFLYCPSYDWEPYMPLIFELFIAAKIERLPNESAQNPSGLLKLFHTWSNHRRTMLLLKYDLRLLPQIYYILTTRSCKDDVISVIVDIQQNIIALIDTEGSTAIEHQCLLSPENVEIFLGCMTVLLDSTELNTKSNIRSDLFDRELEVLSSLAPYATSARSVERLLALLLPVLVMNSNVVRTAIKEKILVIWKNLLPLSDDYLNNTPELWKKYYAVTRLFASIESREGRNALTNLFDLFVSRDPDLTSVSVMIQDINSYSRRRLDTPDFDRRLAAFAQCSQESFRLTSERIWRPLLFNMMFFMNDEDELALRTNGVHCIEHILTSLLQNPDTQDLIYKSLVNDMLPILRKALRHRNEIVRQEWIALLAFVIQHTDDRSTVNDLKVLLADGDEEASFFNNILHIQQHRRIRALRRMSHNSLHNSFSSTNVAHILFPLLEHFCFGPITEKNHNLVAETIKASGILARALQFPQYLAILKRYVKSLKSETLALITIIRLIDAFCDALLGSRAIGLTLVEHLHDEPEIEVDVSVAKADLDEDQEIRSSVLTRTKPEGSNLSSVLESSILLPLQIFLHAKDDDTVHLRVPLALTLTKFLIILPEQIMVAKLPGLLIDVCHILRSRSQDARDMTRKTLGRIAKLLGSKYLSYILTELKTALQRGYQLHVLGFVVHTLLVELNAGYGSLDYCLRSLTDVLIDDIFGEIGLEKDAEEYIGKMKEIKSSKSYDSFELLASSSSHNAFGEILWPLRSLLSSTSSTKSLRKIDEVFRRIILGFVKKQEHNREELLQLAFEVYKQSQTDALDQVSPTKTFHEQVREANQSRFVVDLNRRKHLERDHSSTNAYILAIFAIDIVRSVLEKHKDLISSANITAFVPVLGDCLLTKHEALQVAVLRVLALVMKVDSAALDAGCPVFLAKALSLIRNSLSSRASICQASFKFIANLLEDRPQVAISDRDLSYIITRIRDDLEEPDRQGMTFSILKSIIRRKLLVPELYDVIEDIATMMVTNQSQGPRDAARSIYYQFLLTYPQGPARFRSQLTFLVKNLEYVYPTGRESVMETLNLIVGRFDDGLLQPHLVLLFLSCTMLVVNDEEIRCREMAVALLRKILRRADKERYTAIWKSIKTWTTSDNDALVQASFETLKLIFETRSADCKDETNFFIDTFRHLLKQSDIAEIVLDRSLQTFQRVIINHPSTFISAKFKDIWTAVCVLLLHKNHDIRLLTSQLISTVFSKKQAETTDSLLCGKDLVLSRLETVQLTRAFLIQLRGPDIKEDLAQQVTKNIVFMMRHFYAQKTLLPPKEDEEEAEVEQLCFKWLLKRIHTALQSDRDVKQESIQLIRTKLIQCLAASIQILDGEDVSAEVEVIIKPLYKFSESNSERDAHLKDLAVEALDLIKRKIGALRYAEGYSAVRQAQLSIASERKLKRHIENIRHPEAGARKKLKASLKKRMHRSIENGKYGRDKL